MIDTAAGGALRYRAWNKPRFVTEVPDLEIQKGKQAFDGTGQCSVPVYMFKNGTATYEVRGGTGCAVNPEPPQNATGELEVILGGKPVAHSWCY